MKRIVMTALLVGTISLVAMSGCITVVPQPGITPEPTSTPTPEPTPAPTPTPTPEPTIPEPEPTLGPSPTPPSQLPITDSFQLGPLNEEMLYATLENTQYLSEYCQYPINDYGMYVSEPFFLEEGETIQITAQSDCPFALDNSECELTGGIIGWLMYCDESPDGTEASGECFLNSCEVERPSGSSNNLWETMARFTSHDIDSADFYLLMLQNESGNYVSCQYEISLVESTEASPASLPMSVDLNLATYHEFEIEEYDWPEYSSVTNGCAHVSSIIPLEQGQTITLLVESDCPIHFRWFYPSSPKEEICINVDSSGIESEYPSFFNGGQATRSVVSATSGFGHIRLFAWNHDSDSSHYLQYTIIDGAVPPPNDWTPSSPSPVTLDRSPSDPEVMKYYITPEDPEIQEAAEDILSGEWRWGYSDFEALRQWVFTHVKYRFDHQIHGVSDYWQLPVETLELGTGDCEDFAILLCTLLRAYGVPSDQVYVTCALDEGAEYSHAFLFERYSKGIWEAIEPQDGVWGVFVWGDIDASDYDSFHCFNDQHYLTDKPTLPLGEYEFEAGYSFWPTTRGASVEFERYLDTGERVTGLTEWGKDSMREYSDIIYGWTITAYDQYDDAVFTWSGTEISHGFSFTASQAGIYRIEILKRDYLARCGKMIIEPEDWVQN